MRAGIGVVIVVAGIQQKSNKKRRVVGRPFKKGQSGNPSGKAKGTISLTSRMKRELAANPTLVTSIIKSWAESVVDGSSPHLKEMLDRTEGKVPDKIESDNKVEVIIRYEND